MRLDLFGRRLSSTLVTDFFGGVSQAEVLPPLRVPSRHNVSSDDAPQEAEHYGTPEENGPGSFASVGDISAHAFLAALGEGPKSEVGAPLVRKARTWASTVAVLVLSLWVASRRK